MPPKPKPPSELTENDFANEKMGHNAIQGDDQSVVRRQRHAVPDVRPEADANIDETAQKTDKDERALRDLGKGKGVHPGKSGEKE